MINPGQGCRHKISSVLANELRYIWICSKPDMAEDPPRCIKFDDTVMTHLHSRFPSLDGVVLEEFLRRLHKKIGRCQKNSFESDKDDTTTFIITPKLHCEAALISHLTLTMAQTEQTQMYIATALPSCYACHVFVEVMNDRSLVEFSLRTYNGVLDCGWRLPCLPSDEAEIIQGMMTKKLGRTLDAALEGFRIREGPVSMSNMR